MRLFSLALEGWRNWNAGRIEFNPSLNVFWGDNGQGKTNLLEAIYYLIHLNSFRTRKASELTSWGSTRALVEGQADVMGTHCCLRVELDNSRRYLFINREPVFDSVSYFKGLCGVWFGPQHVELVRGSPSVRRKFMDRVAFRRAPDHLQTVRDYLKVLRSRNTVLKEKRRNLLDAYSQQLAVVGARLTKARIEAIQAVDNRIGSVHAELSGCKEDVALAYRSSWNPKGLIEKGKLEELFLGQLSHNAETDQMRGFTITGPHTDDVGFTVDSRSARKFGSQGQIRTLTLSLSVSEFLALKEDHGESPVFLMDDLSSELDKTRREALIEYLLRLTGQLFVTTTSPGSLPCNVEAKEFHVVDGSVEV